VIANKRGKRQQALDAFVKAVEVNPRNPDALRWAATAYGDIGDLLAERRMRFGAAEAAPDDPFYADDALLFLTKKLGDMPGALEFAKRLLAADPEQAENLLRMGEVYSSIDQPTTALDYLQRAAAADPDNPETYNWLGTVYIKLDRLAEAETVLTRGLTLSPDHAMLNGQLAGVLHRQRRYEEAIEQYERSLSLGQFGPDIVNQLCQLYEQTRAYDRAVSCYRWVLAQFPNNDLARLRYPVALENFRATRAAR
jgi:protein O-GlcNAc transferase